MEAKKEFSYYCEILSQDDKFIRVAEKIHEEGTKALKQITKSLGTQKLADIMPFVFLGFNTKECRTKRHLNDII